MKKILLITLLAAGLAGCNRSPEFYFERGNYLFAAGKDTEALENYSRALLLRRNYPEALTSRGLAFERQGDRQKAGIDYRKAIEFNASFLPAYNNLGALLMDGENYREAVALFTEALGVKPDYSFALLNRGLSFYKLGDCAGATADLTRALELNDKFQMAYYHRALCARKARNLPAELADLDALLALNPAAALAIFERGKALYYMQDYPGAAQEFSKAAGLKPEDPVYAYWLGFALYKAGDLEGALRAASKAAAVKPDSYQLRGLMGDIYAALKDKGNAAAQYRLAAGLSPKSASLYQAKLNALEKPAAPARKKRK